MTTKHSANPVRDGAVEIDETQLAQVSGGSGDYLLLTDGVKGESRSHKVPGLTSSTVDTTANLTLGDGSVRFLR